MKLNKKIFSLTLILSMTLPTLAKPVFADKLNDLENKDEIHSIMVEEDNQDEEVYAERITISPQLYNFVIENLELVNSFLCRTLSDPVVIPLADKIKALKNSWNDFKKYFKEQTGKEVDNEIDAVSHG